MVDFWVSPENWAVELLRDGSDLREHELRFETGGRYHGLPMTAYAVVDFRSQPAAQPRLPRQAPNNTYFVIFAPDYSSATMTKASTGKKRRISLSS